jgi:hypothetical protein
MMGLSNRNLTFSPKAQPLPCPISTPSTRSENLVFKLVIGNPMYGPGAEEIGTIEILSSGWEADLTLTTDTGGTLDLDADGSPNVSLSVRSESFDSSGSATTITRTVHARKLLRQAYPNESSDQITDNMDGTATFRVSLSDYIYADDEIVSASAGSGLITPTSGDPNAAGTLGVTQSSTEAYPLPQAMWLTPDLMHATSTSVTVDLSVVHAFAQQGSAVRAVKFTVTDSSANSDSTTVSSMTSEQFSGSGLYGCFYRGTLDLTGLNTQELLTVDATIYPWVGDSYTISTDANSYPSAQLSVIKVYNDSDDMLGLSYAYVDATSGNDSTAVTSNTPATAQASPYATIEAATLGIQNYNNSNYSRNNTAGGFVRLEVGTHTNSDWSFRNSGDIPLVLEAADSANKATTIWQDKGSSGSDDITDKVRVQNITLRKQTTGNIIWLSSNASSYDNILIIEDCTFDLPGGVTASGAVSAEPGRLILKNVDGDHIGCGTQFGVTSRCATYTIGCAHSTGSASYGVFATKYLSAENDLSTVGSLPTRAGSVCAFSHLAQDTNSDLVVEVDGLATGTAGIGFVGNVFEQYGGTSNPTFAVNADGDTTAIENANDIANTVVGSRTNWMYQDTGTSLVAKSGRSRLSIYREWNCKSDVANTESATIGNWSEIYHVGHYGNAYIRGSNGDDTAGRGSWLGEVLPPNSVTGSDASPLTMNFVDDESNDGGGTGDGDYTPGATNDLPTYSSDLRPFPTDQLGQDLPTDGTAVAGAIQLA